MPAGNDTAYHSEFKSSVESQYGPYSNAEELMRAHAGAVDPGVRRAGLTQVDPEATDELRKGGVTKVEKQFKDVPDGWELVDFAVRGNALVGVFMDERGVHHKQVVGANDRYKTHVGTADEVAQLARGEHDRRVARETARLQQEADEAIAAERARQNERIQKELTKIQNEAAEDLAAAQAEAQQDKGEKPKAEKKSPAGGEGASASRGVGGKAGTAEDPAK